MTQDISPCLPARGGILAGAVSLVANVGLASCSDPLPVQTFRVFVSDQSGRCEFVVDGDVVSFSRTVELARLRGGRRVEARIVSPASGVTPRCAQLARRAVEHARFATVIFRSKNQAGRSDVVPTDQPGFAVHSRKD